MGAIAEPSDVAGDSPQADLKAVGGRRDYGLVIDQKATRDLGDGCVECTVTTPTVDYQGESINTEGIDASQYLLNPVVLYAHEYGQLPIGKSIRLVQQKKSIKSTTQFAINEYEFAGTVYKLVKGGYLNDVSIGLLVKRWSPDYLTLEESVMLEYSHCPIGANPEAKVTDRALVRRSIEAIGKRFEQVQEEYADFVQRTMAHKLQKMPYDQVSNSIRVLKNLVDTLEASETDLSSGEAKTVKRYTLERAKAVATESQRLIKVIKMRE